MEIILDIGSAHGSSLDYLKKAVDSVASEPRIALKCQLWDKGNPASQKNPRLSYALFEGAYEYAKQAGVILSASVFDGDSYEFLAGLRPPWIKFAFSMRGSPLINRAKQDGFTAIVSQEWLDTPIPNVTEMLMPVPGAYPIMGSLAITTEWFDGRFHAMSDHTLGTRQSIRAAACGCKLLEKHVRWTGYEDSPDGRFALDFDRVHEILDEEWVADYEQ